MQASALPIPQPHQVTVREFFLMGEAGVLDPEAKIELIEGVMIDMPPIAPPHAGRTKRLTCLLIEAIASRFTGPLLRYRYSVAGDLGR
jgi:hypothetical protein